MTSFPGGGQGEPSTGWGTPRAQGWVHSVIVYRSLPCPRSALQHGRRPAAQTEWRPRDLLGQGRVDTVEPLSPASSWVCWGQGQTRADITEPGQGVLRSVVCPARKPPQGCCGQQCGDRHHCREAALRSSFSLRLVSEGQGHSQASILSLRRHP